MIAASASRRERRTSRRPPKADEPPPCAAAVGRVAFVVVVAIACVGVASGACVSVPTAAPHARATAKRGAATEVCWLETASTDAPGLVTTEGMPATQTWHATASALLVRTPSGDVLVDTGASPTLERDLSEIDDFHAFLIRDNSGLMPRRASLPDLLDDVHEDRARLRVLLSHAHPDHAGGLASVPDVPVLVPGDELTFAVAHAKAGGDARILPAHVRAMRGRTSTYAFDDGPYETFDASFDVFKDGSVVVVPLSGHTPGSVGTFVNLSSGKRIFHIGDVALVEEGVDAPAMKGVLLSLITDVDREQTASALAQVAQLHKLDPSIVILPAHDRDQWAVAVAPRAVGAPPVCAR